MKRKEHALKEGICGLPNDTNQYPICAMRNESPTVAISPLSPQYQRYFGVLKGRGALGDQVADPLPCVKTRFTSFTVPVSVHPRSQTYRLSTPDSYIHSLWYIFGQLQTIPLLRILNLIPPMLRRLPTPYFPPGLFL